jgi:hypothetical protein
MQMQEDLLAYKVFINKQQDYVFNYAQFAISGLLPGAAQYLIDYGEEGKFTPIDILLSAPTISSILPTNTPGLWVIATTNTQLREAIQYFDSEIVDIYNRIPDQPELVDSDIGVPVRINKTRNLGTSKTLARAKILQQMVPKTIAVRIDNPYKKNHKRNISYQGITSVHKQQKIHHNEKSLDDNTTTTNPTLTTTIDEIISTKWQKIEERLSFFETKINTANQGIDHTKIQQVIQQTVPLQLDSRLNKLTELMESVVIQNANQQNEMLELNKKFNTVISIYSAQQDIESSIKHIRPYNNMEDTPTSTYIPTTLNLDTTPDSKPLSNTKKTPTVATPVTEWNTVPRRRHKSPSQKGEARVEYATANPFQKMGEKQL